MQKMQTLLDEKEFTLAEMTRKCDQYEMLLNSKDGTLKFYETQLKTNMVKSSQTLVEEQLAETRAEYQKTMLMYDRLFVEKNDLKDKCELMDSENGKLRELNEKYTREISELTENTRIHDERKTRLENLQDKFQA